jgi:hypothetical protein
MLDCFNIVARKVARDGGTIQHGWSIGEWPTIMLEAEFHGVWVSASGELIDLTPQADPPDRILFLPDPNRKFEGRSSAKPPHAFAQARRH